MSNVNTALDLYAAALPEHEFDALNAWAEQFYSFQREWLFDTNDFAICNKSRRIGLSHTSAALGVLWGAFHGETTTVVSIGQRESTEVLKTAKKHAGVLAALGSDMARIGDIDNATQLSFASGGRILALPASSGGRGYDGNIILDEYAYQEHADAVYEAAAAVTLLGGRFRVISTPNGVGNGFSNLWDLSEVDTSWKRHEIDIELAESQGFPVDLGKCWTIAKGDPRLFNQLFKCSFLDAILQYLPTEMVDSCRVDDLSGLGDAYYGGLDIGRENDLTVLTVVRYNLRMRSVVRIETRKRTELEDIDEMVKQAFDDYKLRRLCIDETGLGTFPAAQLVKRYSEKHTPKGKRPRVEPLHFTLDIKEELATGLYAAISGDEKTLAIPRTDDALRAIAINDRARLAVESGTAEKLRKEMLSLQRKVTKSGNVQYDTPRTKEGHGDRLFSLALALHATGQQNPMMEALRRRMMMGKAA